MISLALEIEPHFAAEAKRRMQQAPGQPRGAKKSAVENVPQQKSRDRAAASVGVSGKLVSAAKAQHPATTFAPAACGGGKATLTTS